MWFYIFSLSLLLQKGEYLLLGGSVISSFDGSDRWRKEKREGGRNGDGMEEIMERDSDGTGEDLILSDTDIQLSDGGWRRERKGNEKCDRGIKPMTGTGLHLHLFLHLSISYLHFIS